jgi:hypothetical protein
MGEVSLYGRDLGRGVVKVSLHGVSLVHNV